MNHFIPRCLVELLLFVFINNGEDEKEVELAYLSSMQHHTEMGLEMKRSGNFYE